jgi:predicted permease
MMTGICAIIFVLARAILGNVPKIYWLSAALATTNVGYFGIPLAMIVFGPDILGAYVLYIMGGTVFFYTVTQFLILRSQYHFSEAIQRIFHLPVIYALIFGVIAQGFGLRFPAIYNDFFTLMRGAYSVLGMMIIGLILSRQGKFDFNLRDIFGATIIRFLIYPAVTVGLILLDREGLHLFSPEAQKIMLMVSVLPMGIDTASLAAQWRMEPEKIATLTLVNSIMALFLIPLFLPYLLKI